VRPEYGPTAAIVRRGLGALAGTARALLAIRLGAATADLEVGLVIYNAGASDRTTTFLENELEYSLKQIKLDGRRWVTVLGDGRLGLLVAQVLQTAGVPVRVIGKHASKLALCEKWGIRSRLLDDIVPRHDQDVVIDCTGSAAGLPRPVGPSCARR